MMMDHDYTFRVLFYCEYCPKSYPLKATLSNHIRVNHNSTNDKYKLLKTFLCDFCVKSYSSQTGLSSHIRAKHKDRYVTKKKNNHCSKAKQFYCDYCSKSYSLRPSLLQHLKLKHNQQLDNRSKNLKCNDCGSRFYEHLDFVNHLTSVHNVLLTKQMLTFDTLQDFKSWKEEEECRLNTFYRLTSKGSTHSYYTCNRNRRLSGLKSCRSLAQNDSQTRVYCPSRMVLRNVNNKIEIVYYKNHHGHHSSMDSERKLIVDYLNMGIPEWKIQELCKQNIEHSTKLTNIHIKEIYKIKNSLRDVKDEFLYLETLMTTDNNQIRFYEKKFDSSGKLEQFQLVLITDDQIERAKCLNQRNDSDRVICMDSIRNTNRYNLNLTIIVTVDSNNRRTFPVAYFVSSKIDHESMKLFFKVFKQYCGEIDVGTFIDSGDGFDLSMYQAWIDQMPIPKQRLLCGCHLIRVWIRNFSKLPSSKFSTKLRTVIKRKLYSLLYEIDQDRFNRKIAEFLHCLTVDKCHEFRDYFMKQYLENDDCPPEIWAYCFRKDMKNIKVRNFHKGLKGKRYLAKRKYRLDDLYDHLIRYQLDQLKDNTGTMQDNANCNDEEESLVPQEEDNELDRDGDENPSEMFQKKINQILEKASKFDFNDENNKETIQTVMQYLDVVEKLITGEYL